MNYSGECISEPDKAFAKEFENFVNGRMASADKTGREPTSWVWVILILLPFIVFLYVRYYKPPKLSNLKESYASKSNTRLPVGRLFYLVYCLIT